MQFLDKNGVQSAVSLLQTCRLDELRQANCQLEQQNTELLQRVLELEKASSYLNPFDFQCHLVSCSTFPSLKTKFNNVTICQLFWFAVNCYSILSRFAVHSILSIFVEILPISTFILIVGIDGLVILMYSS